jgi:hypothetical protein
MTGEAKSGPVFLAPAEFIVEDADAQVNAKRWALKIENGKLWVFTWNDEKTYHDTLIIERTGVVGQVVLPPQPDLTLLVRQFPPLEHIMPMLKAARRLIEVGAQERLQPQLVHTKLARALWPIFGRPDAIALTGMAQFFGVNVVWAPPLDQYVVDPFAKVETTH